MCLGFCLEWFLDDVWTLLKCLWVRVTAEGGVLQSFRSNRVARLIVRGSALIHNSNSMVLGLVQQDSGALIWGSQTMPRTLKT